MSDTHTYTHLHMHIVDKLNMIFKFKFECQFKKFINLRAMPRLNMKVGLLIGDIKF